jgi:hypothetical protein
MVLVLLTLSSSQSKCAACTRIYSFKEPGLSVGYPTFLAISMGTLKSHLSSTRLGDLLLVGQISAKCFLQESEVLIGSSLNGEDIKLRLW